MAEQSNETNDAAEATTNLTRVVSEAVEKGATTAEEIHKAVAAMPLDVLGELGFTGGPVKEIRRVQDLSIGAVYDLIRDVNRQVTQLAEEILSQRQPGSKQGSEE